MISYYDPNVQGLHVIRVTFMVCDFVGHIAYAMGGNCCGADLINPDFLDTDDRDDIEKYKENDCLFRFDDESEMFTAVLKNAQNDEDKMEFEGDAEDFKRIIVGIEIADFIPE